MEDTRVYNRPSLRRLGKGLHRICYLAHPIETMYFVSGPCDMTDADDVKSTIVDVML